MAKANESEPSNVTLETRKKWMHFCLRASGGSGGPCEVALITVFNSLASLWGVAAAAAAYMQEANG
ncbi:hypothetical protein OUZ56_008912 [Daphnia magna]|uniref:CASP-like protein n=1 Tax=Daphnia magna TaxID=35525 RepID=A0ABR0AEF4_9CRUS|nr:hypothetical protein OUZ56_008912 [Daphnia magna]